LKRIGVLLCLLLLVDSAAVAAKSKSHPESRTDTDYITALGVANHFLYAWASQDHEAGLMLLTDNARSHESEDHLEAFFSAAPNTRQGFEISRGKRLHVGRYSFPIALFEFTLGRKPAIHRRFSQIIVIRAATKDDWAVDNVP